jgi:hypothetical protein
MRHRSLPRWLRPGRVLQPVGQRCQRERVLLPVTTRPGRATAAPAHPCRRRVPRRTHQHAVARPRWWGCPAAPGSGASRQHGHPGVRRSLSRAGLQPDGLSTLIVDAGFAASLSSGRLGLATSSPPQFGHLPPSFSPAQAAQNVHSNEQSSRRRPKAAGRGRSTRSLVLAQARFTRSPRPVPGSSISSMVTMRSFSSAR